MTTTFEQALADALEGTKYERNGVDVDKVVLSHE